MIAPESWASAYRVASLALAMPDRVATLGGVAGVRNLLAAAIQATEHALNLIALHAAPSAPKTTPRRRGRAKLTAVKKGKKRAG